MKTPQSSTPVTISFTRKFNKGALAGLTHDDSLAFPNRAAAQRWVEGVKKHAAAGALDWELAGYTVDA